MKTYAAEGVQVSRTTRRANPNINAVAREAGVSVGTVSNALNNPQRLAEDTLQRVQEAIDSLGYIRSSAGRTLIRNRSDSLGLVTPDLVNELFVRVARGAQATASANGQRLVMANSLFNAHDLASGVMQHDLQDSYLEYFAEARTDGVLVASMRDPTAGIERIRNHVRPIVVINYDVPGADWCTVLMDNAQVGRSAVAHIADLGIRRAFFVSIPDIVQPVIERRRGAHEEAARRGIDLIDVDAAGLDSAAGQAAAATIIPQAAGERIAVLALSDDLAAGVLRTLRTSTALRVPEDVAVVGLDGDHRDAGLDWITLTSIELPGYEMGAQAIRLLEAEAQPGHVHERVVVPVPFTPRQSTVGFSEARPT
ncbi:LacI family DNA-binding transcriptional regulator [Microbacterium sp. NPDC055903]